MGTSSAAEPEPVRISPGTSEKIVLDERAGPFRRSFRLHVPASLQDDAPRPLVVALHGGLATASIFERQSGLSELADRHGFFVVYPNGLGIFSLLRHWNGGYCCAKALATELDDLGFLDRVVEWIQSRYAIDDQRLYVIGYSNGGMLAYWYAAERADKLAGLGIWASSIGSLETDDLNWHLPPPTAALPVFIGHGVDDSRLPFDVPASRGGQQLLGAVGSAQTWAENNGCDELPVINRSRSGTIEHRAWCASDRNRVILLGLEGWGHDWPGPRTTSRLEDTHPLSGFDLAEQMWEFLAQAKRP